MRKDFGTNFKTGTPSGETRDEMMNTADGFVTMQSPKFKGGSTVYKYDGTREPKTHAANSRTGASPELIEDDHKVPESALNIQKPNLNPTAMTLIENKKEPHSGSIRNSVQGSEKAVGKSFHNES